MPFPPWSTFLKVGAFREGRAVPHDGAQWPHPLRRTREVGERHKPGFVREERVVTLANSPVSDYFTRNKLTHQFSLNAAAKKGVSICDKGVVNVRLSRVPDENLEVTKGNTARVQPLLEVGG